MRLSLVALAASVAAPTIALPFPVYPNGGAGSDQASISHSPSPSPSPPPGSLTTSASSSPRPITPVEAPNGAHPAAQVLRSNLLPIEGFPKDASPPPQSPTYPTSKRGIEAHKFIFPPMIGEYFDARHETDDFLSRIPPRRTPGPPSRSPSGGTPGASPFWNARKSSEDSFSSTKSATNPRELARQRRLITNRNLGGKEHNVAAGNYLGIFPIGHRSNGAKAVAAAAAEANSGPVGSSTQPGRFGASVRTSSPEGEEVERGRTPEVNPPEMNEHALNSFRQEISSTHSPVSHKVVD